MRKNAVIIKPLTTGPKWSQCDGKPSYDKRTAIEKAKAAAYSGRTKQMAAYPCSYCNRWHLTHKLD